MKSFFWNPEEISMSKDINDFKTLTPGEEHIFTSNLRRQIILDSVQGRAPVEAFLPICSNSELESSIIWWDAFEQIHSESYTHIIRNVYSNPSIVFDNIFEIQEIVDCAKDISKYYDELIKLNHEWALSGEEATYEHKKALWLTLASVNALEGIRFYVSFLCTWNFAEQGKMEGSAKTIKLICRDENQHLFLTQYLLLNLPKESEDFAKIKQECEEEVIQIFESVERQEKEWADYLFQHGSMIGLNATILKDYVSYITKKRMKTIGYKYRGTNVVKSDPCPWSASWIGGSDVQVAPQEVELSSYLVGQIDTTVDVKGFGLTL
jgi:ribonucleoside-diphosphate reductase beta chain